VLEYLSAALLPMMSEVEPRAAWQRLTLSYLLCTLQEWG
jgi:hypothetical protein